MTERLFLDQSQASSGSATVVASGPEGVVLDRTLFYARSGGQPGDVGTLRWDGGEMAIADTVKGEGETILHLPAPDSALPPAGTPVEMQIDWDTAPQADAVAHGACIFCAPCCPARL